MDGMHCWIACSSASHGICILERWPAVADKTFLSSRTKFVEDRLFTLSKGSLLNIGNEPASLEIVLCGLRDGHWLNVLLGEKASWQLHLQMWQSGIAAPLAMQSLHVDEVMSILHILIVAHEHA